MRSRAFELGCQAKVLKVFVLDTVSLCGLVRVACDGGSSDHNNIAHGNSIFNHNNITHGNSIFNLERS